MKRAGQCLCGAVTFTACDVTDEVHACHCKMCQRWAGGMLMAVTVPAKDIIWTGEEHIGRMTSSEWAERGWCTKCGSGLFYRITAEGPYAGNHEIPLGLFDDANGFRLTREIFVDRKSDSFELVGQHHMMTEAEVLAMFSGSDNGS